MNHYRPACIFPYLLLRISAFLLAFSLLNGCAANGDAKAQPSAPAGKGRYIETRLPLPEEILFPILFEFDEAGELELLALEEESLAWYRQKNGSFVRSEPAWLPNFSENLQPTCAVKAEEGKTWLLCAEYREDETIIPHLFEADETFGTLREIVLEEGPEPCQSLGEMQLLADGSLLIESFPSGILRCSPEGTLLQTYSLNHSGFTAVNDSLFLAPYSGPLVELSLKTADEKAQHPCPEDTSSILFSEGDILYAANSAGLFRLTEGGYETLLEGGRFTLSSQNFAPARIAKQEETFAILYTDRRDFTPALFLYTFDPDASAASRTLRIQSLYDFELVREAASEMQRRDPGLTAEVEVLLGEESGMTVSDAIKSMNTALLAGRGADVYILDGMPLKSLSEKGVLLEISDLVNTRAASGEWLPNIAGSLAGETGLYALPVKFGIPILWGETQPLTACETLEKLADFAKTQSSPPLFYGMHPKNLIQRFFPVCAPGFLQEDGTVDSTRFAAFLEPLKTLADTAPGAEYQAQGNGMDGSMEVPAYHEGLCRMIAQEVLSDRLLDIDMSASADRGEAGDFTPLPGQAQGVFIPRIIAGINAKSEQIEDAKTLLETMLEEGIQSIDYSDYEGLPVNTQALEKGIRKKPEDKLPLMVGYGMGDDNLVLVQVDDYPTADMQERFLSLCRSAKIPSLADPVLLEMVMDETAAFFEGGQTAAQAAEAVRARTEAYLNE